MTPHLAEALRVSIDLTAQARMAVEDAISVYDNDDAVARRLALAAFEQDRPAFWTTATYHSQKASLFQQAANYKPLLEALHYAYNRGDDYIAALDTLVPLNDQAALAMVIRYSDYGIWRDTEELLARRYRRMRP